MSLQGRVLQQQQRCSSAPSRPSKSLPAPNTSRSSTSSNGSRQQQLLQCRAAPTAAAAAAGSEVDQTLNPRVASLSVSKTMALTDMARSMKESGIDVIGLAAGEPDFDTPAPIVEAGIQALRDGVTRYTPNTGTAALRAAIAKKLKGGWGVQWWCSYGDRVCPGGGGQKVGPLVGGWAEHPTPNTGTAALHAAIAEKLKGWCVERKAGECCCTCCGCWSCRC
jgi:hypothetical protein